MERKNRKKSTMTIDKLARITQDEFSAADKKFANLQEAVVGLDVKIDRFQEEVRGDTANILKSVEKIAGKFDKQEKEDAAHAMLHHRISDTLHDHDKRIKKLEVRV